jgi:hypothetical protein
MDVVSLQMRGLNQRRQCRRLGWALVSWRVIEEASSVWRSILPLTPGRGALALLGRLDGEARDHARCAFDDPAV